MSNVARDEAILALRKYGFGPREIARKMEISPNVVAGVLHRSGHTHLSESDTLATAPRPRGRPRIASDIRAAAVRLSWETTLSNAAKAFGVSESSIVNWRSAA